MFKISAMNCIQFYIMVGERYKIVMEGYFDKYLLKKFEIRPLSQERRCEIYFISVLVIKLLIFYVFF